MSENEPVEDRDNAPEPPCSPLDESLSRVQEALRQNLLRRKQQQRQRKEKKIKFQAFMGILGRIFLNRPFFDFSPLNATPKV